jgi:hypothetical protein
MLGARSLLRLLPLTLVAALAPGMAGATAAPPALAGGTFTTTAASVTNPRTAGSNTIFDLTFTGSWTATIPCTRIVRPSHSLGSRANSVCTCPTV